MLKNMCVCVCESMCVCFVERERERERGREGETSREFDCLTTDTFLRECLRK